MAFVEDFLAIGPFLRYAMTGEEESDLRVDKPMRRFAVMPAIWQMAFMDPGSVDLVIRPGAWSFLIDSEYYPIEIPPPTCAGVRPTAQGVVPCPVLRERLRRDPNDPWCPVVSRPRGPVRSPF